MVLDAVERIEHTIAAHKREAADEGLEEALAAIRRAVDQAQAAAASAVEGLALEENLAPVRKGARTSGKSPGGAEIGADGRICDLLDSQVSAIEAACGQIASHSPQAALGRRLRPDKPGSTHSAMLKAAIPQATEAVIQQKLQCRIGRGAAEAVAATVEVVDAVTEAAECSG